jgi:short-subunit dehydrogenase
MAVKTSGSLRAVVTGASSGIGAAFARELGRRGEPLVLVARRADRLAELARAIGGDVVTIPLDLAKPSGPADLCAELEARGLECDLLVNNAGIGLRGAIATSPVEALLGIVDLNCRTLLELTRRVLPGMLERGRGRIVNVASMASFQPVPYLGVYAASKAFVLSLTEALEAELRGTGVRVQALCPGNIPTEFQGVAGTKGSLYDRTPGMSAEAVARASLDSLARRGGRLIPRFLDRLTLATQAVSPRGVVVRVSGELFRPRDPSPGSSS